MVNETHIKDILPKIGFDHFDYVPPVNYSGGIAVLWNSGKLHASILQKEPWAIYLLMHDTTNTFSSPAQQREKEAFWNHLRDLNGIFDLPWCIIGDFNELANPSEKREGQIHQQQQQQQHLPV